MATKYAKSAQTGESGVSLVRKIATDAGGIFRPFEASDLGIDAVIEFLTSDREPSGDIVLVQIKAGASYIRAGKFFLDSDRDHFETWSRYGLPVVGIVCDLAKGEARWINITAHLRKNPDSIANGPYSLEAKNAFSESNFPNFANNFRRVVAPNTRVDVTPNLLIRPWKPEDTKATRALLQIIAADYPEFDTWLNKKFADLRVSKKVVEIDNVIAAFSMWQPKDKRCIKLQTFIVGPSYRGSAIGQHLLYHELRTWTDDPDIERVHVTLASSKSELVEFFHDFGFRVEGVAASRYPRPSAEVILAKHLVRKVVRTSADLSAFANELYNRFWGLSSAQQSRFGLVATDFAIPLQLPELRMSVNLSESTASPRIELKGNDGGILLSYDDEALMREFYPLRLHLKDKRYVLVPIYPAWVEAMLSPSSGPHTSLKLRVDHVYYCYPKISDLKKGDFVIFYETKTGGGRGVAIGSATVQEVLIDTPAKLFGKFSKFGIYKQADVVNHQNNDGNSMAIKFTLFESFKKEVDLSRIRHHIGKFTTVQGLTPVSRDAFETIRLEGLS